MTGGVRSVSVLPGFAFSDTPHAGFAVVAVADDPQRAEDAVASVAGAAWTMRERFRRDTIDLDTATRLALAAGRDGGQPAIFADVADNPGGGGRGNTSWLLESFHRAGVTQCAIGMMFDPPLVADAVAVGVGGRLIAHFNRAEPSVFSRPYAAEAEVLALTDGQFTGSVGMAAGMPVNLGSSALLAIGGLKVTVASHRTQVLGIDYFTHAGVDPATVRSYVVKSRGHFRAGFTGFAAPERVYEVATPGLTTPDLASIDWQALPRPSFPLDADADWSQAIFRRRMPRC
jgi:microcystin degradation protein MlrC